MTLLRKIMDLFRPPCQHCDGKGGWMSGYYEPEWTECELCNHDLYNEDDPTRVWRWQWWWFQYREWRWSKRMDAWIDAEVLRDSDLRNRIYGDGRPW